MTHQVTLFAHGLAPNPPKVAILLEELKVDYVVVKKELGDVPNGVKAPDFLKLNPWVLLWAEATGSAVCPANIQTTIRNGRVPALIDHTNNDHVVWESGAILLYISERFDTTGRFTGKALEERSQVWEWLFFQVSGLGPSQGQVAWFIHSHPVKDLHPSVLERYQNECYRIYGVLEKRLEEEGEWLALKRFTVADIAHYPWLRMTELTNYPKLQAYHKRIQELPSVKQAYAKLSAVQ